MDNPSITIPVEILGKEYLVNCGQEEAEDLKTAAAALNLRLDAIRASGKILGSDRITIMAALNLSHELNKVTAQMAAAEKRIRGLSEKLELALGNGESPTPKASTEESTISIP